MADDLLVLFTRTSLEDGTDDFEALWGATNNTSCLLRYSPSGSRSIVKSMCDQEWLRGNEEHQADLVWVVSSRALMEDWDSCEAFLRQLIRQLSAQQMRLRVGVHLRQDDSWKELVQLSSKYGLEADFQARIPYHLDNPEFKDGKYFYTPHCPKGRAVVAFANASGLEEDRALEKLRLAFMYGVKFQLYDLTLTTCQKFIELDFRLQAIAEGGQVRESVVHPTPLNEIKAACLDAVCYLYGGKIQNATGKNLSDPQLNSLVNILPVQGNPEFLEPFSEDLSSDDLLTLSRQFNSWLRELRDALLEICDRNAS